MQQNILPKKIIASKNVKNETSLFLKKDLQIDVLESDKLSILGEGYIILDFGKEMCGGIKIFTLDVEMPGGAIKIRVRFGESLEECCSEIGEKNSTNNHSPRDFEQILVSFSGITLGETGYRFVRLDFPKDSNASIKSIVGINNILRKTLKNNYCGSDKDIKRIFTVAKRTIDLCSGSEYIWDGIKRDRLVWSGDLYPEILALTTLYGRVEQIEKTLDFERTHKKFQNKWISWITTYAMWWVACVAEYYFRTNAKEFAKKQLNCIQETILLFNGCVDEDGAMHYPEHFVDWSTRNSEDEELGSRLISIYAVKKSIKLLNDFGCDTKPAEFLLKKLMNAEFTVKTQKQVIALKFFALGKISDEEYARLIDGGAKGFSTYLSYFILTTIADRDRNLAINLMKEYFGGMIKKGATTFWEDFDIDWIKGSGRIDRFTLKGEKDIHGDFGKFCYKGFRHSLCHGWSSGVICFIHENCQ